MYKNASLNACMTLVSRENRKNNEKKKYKPKIKNNFLSNFNTHTLKMLEI